MEIFLIFLTLLAWGLLILWGVFIAIGSRSTTKEKLEVKLSKLEARVLFYAQMYGGRPSYAIPGYVKKETKENLIEIAAIKTKLKHIKEKEYELQNKNRN